jgi:outer membrane protein assembly factor BamB
MKELRALMALLLGASVALAGDWPQWLGPRRDNSSQEIVKPWTEPLKILWKQPVAEAHSSPVVAQGRVYLHTAVAGKDEEALTAYDAKSGKQLWQTAYPRAPFKNPFGNGPRATPSVNADKVYAFGITGLLTCFAADTGKQLWQVDTLKKYNAPNLVFGVSCSPLIEGDLLFVNVGGKGSSIVAFDKNTGEERWKGLDDPASYSSPIGIKQAGEREIVFLTAKGLVALAPKDGSVFWKYPLVDKLAESSTTPVVAGDILFGSSITIGGVGLRLQASEGKPGVKEAWMKPDLNCYFSTPVAVGKDYLYIVTGSSPFAFVKQATLRCVEAQTGKELWSRGKVGTYHASLLRTGDSKLLMVEEAGNLVLLQPKPESYDELARSKICGQTWAHPALAERRLFIRDSKQLVCVEMPE